MCHGSALPRKRAFKELKNLENFATAAQGILKILKKSPQKEGHLKDME